MKPRIKLPLAPKLNSNICWAKVLGRMEERQPQKGRKIYKKEQGWLVTSQADRPLARHRGVLFTSKCLSSFLDHACLWNFWTPVHLSGSAQKQVPSWMRRLLKLKKLTILFIHKPDKQCQNIWNFVHSHFPQNDNRKKIDVTYHTEIYIILLGRLNIVMMPVLPKSICLFKMKSLNKIPMEFVL